MFCGYFTIIEQSQAQKVKFQVLKPEHSFEVPTSIDIYVLPNSPGEQELGPPFSRWGKKKVQRGSGSGRPHKKVT